jgi:hypothetical protein
LRETAEDKFPHFRVPITGRFLFWVYQSGADIDRKGLDKTGEE